MTFHYTDLQTDRRGRDRETEKDRQRHRDRQTDRDRQTKKHSY